MSSHGLAEKASDATEEPHSFVEESGAPSDSISVSSSKNVASYGKVKVRGARSTITLYERHLLRGTTAAVLLARCGKRLRSTAGGIGTLAQADDEFNKSFVVPDLDIFLSHSWHARWWLKYFTLLLYFNAMPALIWSMSLSCLTCYVRFKCYIDGSVPTEWAIHGPCFVLGSLVFFACLFFWQHLIAGLNVSGSLFLDKVCIHQTDEDQKERGIKSIGAILGKSRMVLVAWDPSYFSRLWCTFELAAYKYAKADAPIIVLPVFLGGFIAGLIFLQFLSEVTVNLITHIEIPGLSFLTNKFGTYMSVYFLQSIVCSMVFRKYVAELNKLSDQLENFSVRKASCFCCSNDHMLDGRRLPCDRELVNASIAHWHGDDDLEDGLNKFDDLIRGTFSHDIAQAFRGSRVPYKFVLTTTVWAGLYQIERIHPTRVNHGELVPRILEMLNSTFLMYPMNIAILINVCCRIFVAFGSDISYARFLDIALAGVSTAVMCGEIKFSSYWIRERYDTYWGIIYMAVEAVVVWLLYRRAKRPPPTSSTDSRIPKLTIMPTSATELPSAFTGFKDDLSSFTTRLSDRPSGLMQDSSPTSGGFAGKFTSAMSMSLLRRSRPTRSDGTEEGSLDVKRANQRLIEMKKYNAERQASEEESGSFIGHQPSRNRLETGDSSRSCGSSPKQAEKSPNSAGRQTRLRFDDDFPKSKSSRVRFEGEPDFDAQPTKDSFPPMFSIH